MKPLVISAPFGNWIQRPYATSTLGTFTVAPRGGRLYRLWRVLRTLRYHRRSQSWTNKLGLPNPGIDDVVGRVVAVDGSASRSIVSIFGFSRDEWTNLVSSCLRIGPLAIEFNLSCPNVKHSVLVHEVEPAVYLALKRRLALITKLPPVRWMDLARPLYSLGVRHFHCCNTIPTLGGGLSGKVLKQYSLWAVAELRQTWGADVDITGGGGITCVEDVRDYISAGANRVAVGSMLLNPLNWRRLESLAQAASEDLMAQPSSSEDLMVEPSSSKCKDGV